MRDLPAGTVTFLFTDIEGSTALLRELGAERYADALAEHRRVLRASFASHGGIEVDTQGDAFFVAFNGRIDESERTCSQSLELAREIGDRQAMVYGLAHLARTSAVKWRPARAGLLWGVLEAEAERAPLGQWEIEKEEYANGVLVAHGAEFDLAYAQGRALSFDTAVDEALRAATASG